MLQVVRGGQFPELRMRPTLQALPALVQARLMPADSAESLAQAYEFLRRVEHRVQYLDDKQTHVLPTDEDDLRWIALSMQLPDTDALDSQLQFWRDKVANEFERLLRPAAAAPSESAPVATSADIDSLLDNLSPALRQRVATWSDAPRIRALREDARQRLFKLVQRTQTWLGQGRVSEAAALRWCDWMEPLLRRETYLALLLERPPIHAQLLKLLDAGRWTTTYLMKHPGVIDELADAIGPQCASTPRCTARPCWRRRGKPA